MDLGLNTMLFIGGIGVFIYLAFKRIRKLEEESEDHSKKIYKLGNDLESMKKELEEKEVITWEDSFVNKIMGEYKSAVQPVKKDED